MKIEQKNKILFRKITLINVALFAAKKAERKNVFC